MANPTLLETGGGCDTVEDCRTLIKRYLVFAYDTYYPGGGWGDLQFTADSEDEIRTQIEEISKKRYFDHWEIVDLQTGLVTSDRVSRDHSKAS